MMPPPTSSASAIPAYELSVSSLLSESWRRMRLHGKTLIALGAIAVISGVVVLTLGRFNRPSSLDSMLRDMVQRGQQINSSTRTAPGQIDIPHIRDLDGRSASPGPSMAESALANLLGLLLFLVNLGVLSASIYVMSQGSRVPFHDAVRRGLSRVLPVTGRALLLFLIFSAIFVVPLALTAGAAIGGVIAATQGGGMSVVSGLLKAGLLTGIVASALGAFFAVRLLFVLPLAALGQGRPFGGSWDLTRGKFWMVFWRLIVVGLISVVSMLASWIVLGPLVFLPGISIVASIALKAFNYGAFLFGIAHIVVLLQALQREQKGAA